MTKSVFVARLKFATDKTKTATLYPYLGQLDVWCGESEVRWNYESIRRRLYQS